VPAPFAAAPSLPSSLTMSRMIWVIVEVLGRCTPGDDRRSAARNVLVGDDSADDDRGGDAGLATTRQHRGISSRLRAGQDRQPDHVDALLQRRRRDLRRRQGGIPS